MKERIGQIKEFASKLGSKTKKLIIAVAVVLLLGAIALAYVMNSRPYQTLFYDLGSEEARKIAEKLQEEGIEYRFQGDSTILVREDVLDSTKATLVQ